MFKGRAIGEVHFDEPALTAHLFDQERDVIRMNKDVGINTIALDPWRLRAIEIRRFCGSARLQQAGVNGRAFDVERVDTS